jgi:hypothetical protein
MNAQSVGRIQWLSEVAWARSDILTNRYFAIASQMRVWTTDSACRFIGKERLISGKQSRVVFFINYANSSRTFRRSSSAQDPLLLV